MPIPPMAYTSRLYVWRVIPEPVWIVVMMCKPPFTVKRILHFLLKLTPLQYLGAMYRRSYRVSSWTVQLVDSRFYRRTELG